MLANCRTVLKPAPRSLPQVMHYGPRCKVFRSNLFTFGTAFSKVRHRSSAPASPLSPVVTSPRRGGLALTCQLFGLKMFTGRSRRRGERNQKADLEMFAGRSRAGTKGRVLAGPEMVAGGRGPDMFAGGSRRAGRPGIQLHALCT